MPSARFYLRAIIALATLLGAAILAPRAMAGEFESLLQGRIIAASDGLLHARLKLLPMSKATAEISAQRTLDGLWWARPDGRVCVSFKAFWEGGDCGFIRKTATGYALTLAPWSPLSEWTETRTKAREPLRAPDPAPGMIKLTRQKLIGHTLVVEGRFATVGTFFKDDGTFDYKSESELSFTGHWWIRDDGALCLVSRHLWNIGSCFEAHGGAASIDYLVLLRETSSEWYRATLRSGPVEPLEIR